MLLSIQINHNAQVKIFIDTHHHRAPVSTLFNEPFGI